MEHPSKDRTGNTGNKVRTYLLYAIGEILLVVIGILIALQVNNWNEERKQGALEVQYLNNISADLEDQLITNARQIEFEAEKLQQTSVVIGSFNRHQNFVNDPDILDSITTIFSTRLFRGFISTVNEMESSGTLSLIKDEDLRNEILAYYSELEAIEKVINNNNATVADVMKSEILTRSMPSIADSTYEWQRYLFESGANSVISNIVEISSPNFNPTLVQILSDPKEELILANAITTRQTVSIIHAGILHSVNDKTEILLTKIRNYLT